MIGQDIVESSDALAIAINVTRHTPDWFIPDGQNKPKRGEEGENIVIQRIIGGQLIIEEFTQKLTTGHEQYSYPSSGVAGLTSVSSDLPIYGTMAPDQYYLQQPIRLDESLQNKLAERLGEDKEKIKAALEGIEVRDFDNGVQVLENALRSYLTTPEKQMGAFRLFQSYIASHHIAEVAQQIGTGEPKQYAVITITGAKQTETMGFGIGQNLSTLSPSKQSSHTLQTKVDGKSQSVSSVALYEGHNPNIVQQMIIQSDQKIEGVQSKIAITGSDMEHLVRFYEETMKKGIPVAVNCTDGIDRTGIIMVAMSMLHEFDSNKEQDFTKLPAQEQEKKVIGIIEQLKRDRGPYFLRQEHDTARAVVLGYALIITQKQMEIQRDLLINSELDPQVKILVEQSETLEPAELKKQVDILYENVDEKNQSFMKPWKEILSNRVKIDDQFKIVKDEFSDEIKQIKGEIHKAKEPSNYDRHFHAAEASPDLLHELTLQGYDLGTLGVKRETSKTKVQTSESKNWFMKLVELGAKLMSQLRSNKTSPASINESAPLTNQKPQDIPIAQPSKQTLSPTPSEMAPATKWAKGETPEERLSEFMSTRSRQDIPPKQDKVKKQEDQSNKAGQSLIFSLKSETKKWGEEKGEMTQTASKQDNSVPTPTRAKPKTN